MRGPGPAWRPVLVVALGAVALLLVVADRYGFHRDERYFLEGGDGRFFAPLGWAYVARSC
jgi:hypothetical protein